MFVGVENIADKKTAFVDVTAVHIVTAAVVRWVVGVTVAVA